MSTDHLTAQRIAPEVFPLPLGEGQGEGLAGTPELVHSFFLFGLRRPTEKEIDECLVLQ